MDNNKGLIEELLNKLDFNTLDTLIESEKITLNEIIEVLISLNNSELIYFFMKRNYKIPYDLLIKKVIELKDYECILKILTNAVTEEDKIKRFIDSPNVLTYYMIRYKNFEVAKNLINLELSKRNFELTLFEKSIFNNLSLLLNGLKDCEDLLLLKRYVGVVSDFRVKDFLEELIFKLSPESLHPINNSSRYDNCGFDLSQLSSYQQERYLSYMETVCDKKKINRLRKKKPWYRY